MSEMIERVARALDPDMWQAMDSGSHMPTSKALSLSHARAAIEAMRTPAEAMVHAGIDAWTKSPMAVSTQYTAMIAAALQETKP